MTEDWPRELQMQKKRLISVFRKAKEEGKKLHGRLLIGIIGFTLKAGYGMDRDNRLYMVWNGMENGME